MRKACAATEAEHVFIWQHHPVGTGNGAVGPTPVHVYPSLKANFDAEIRMMLPPGWVTYEFEVDAIVARKTAQSEENTGLELLAAFLDRSASSLDLFW